MLTPDKVRYECGVKICEKIIPDSARATKYVASHVKKGDPMKPRYFMTPIGVTIHNTEDLKGVHEDAEQYTRATWPNCNMGGVVVHYYTDDVSAWQNLRENESGWHAADGQGNGNRKTIAIESIMDGSGSAEDLKAFDNTARLTAAILYRHGWSVNDVYTHNHWMGMPDKIVAGASKNCPVYILPKWAEFKKLVQKYLNELKKGTNLNESTANKVKVKGTASTGTNADAKKIWDFLSSKINNPYGVAGLMGNLYAESALRSNNLQNTFEAKLGFTDATYTQAVDNGSYDNFVKDSAGYGLAQWTYWSRKKALYEFATGKKTSVGDLTIQLNFLVTELSTSYKAVWTALKSAKSVKEASDIVLTKFEKPADQSDSVKVKRAGFGQKYYDAYAPKATTKPATKPTAKPATPALKFKAGDIVQVKEGTQYVQADGASGKKFKACKAKITATHAPGKHPYHCRAIDAKGNFVSGNLYGWVDVNLISAVKADTTIKVGSKVKIKVGAVYGGLAGTRGSKVPSDIIKRTHTVKALSTHKGVKEARLAEINSWVAVASLKKV